MFIILFHRWMLFIKKVRSFCLVFKKAENHIQKMKVFFGFTMNFIRKQQFHVWWYPKCSDSPHTLTKTISFSDSKLESCGYFCSWFHSSEWSWASNITYNVPRRIWMLKCLFFFMTRNICPCCWLVGLHSFYFSQVIFFSQVCMFQSLKVKPVFADMYFSVIFFVGLNCRWSLSFYK